LLDDFSGSGSSYYALGSEAGKPLGGKIAKFHRRLTDWHDPLSRLVDLEDLEVVILLYVATEGARDYLRRRSAELWGGRALLGRDRPDDSRVLPAGPRVGESAGGLDPRLLRPYGL
jgi:hypothetical protein